MVLINKDRIKYDSNNGSGSENSESASQVEEQGVQKAEKEDKVSRRVDMKTGGKLDTANFAVSRLPPVFMSTSLVRLSLVS